MWALIGTIIIGGIAGWIAGEVYKGDGFGVIKNVLLGIAGGFLGDFIFRILGIGGSDNLIIELLTSFGGAVLILFIVKKVRAMKM